jgi:hypothetical protein
MKNITFLIVLFIFIVTGLNAQTIKLQEGFESADSITLPPGWTVVNDGGYITDPFWNWTVRDTGVSLPGLASGTGKAHTGLKSCGVSWYVSYDTSGAQHLPDAWLITKRVENIANGDLLKFWGSGGATSYLDSIQIYVSVTDSLPASMIFYLGSIIWPVGSTFGNFTQYTYDLSAYAGATAWIGFRYVTDCTVDGFFVFVDDVEVLNPIGIKPIGGNVPNTFALRQNYPNPFNPVTNIEFDLPKGEFVRLIVFNSIGQEVKTLVNETKPAGSYKVDFDALGLPSGAYFYRITAGDFVQTNKMILVK